MARITRMIKEPGLENEHELHELDRLEDDAIFFQSLWVAEVEQEA